MKDSSISLDHNDWTDDELLECVSVISETSNTMSFSFCSPSGALFRYKAGQFLTLEIPLPGGSVFRTYTISSSPTRPHLITLTIKAQADSVGSRWLMDHFTSGMTIKAIGPAGHFTYVDQLPSDHHSVQYLFISAGSGVTPMISMVTDMLDRNHDIDIVFVYCTRRPSDIIFRKRLEEMAARHPNFNLKFIVKEADAFQAWTGYQGRFNLAMLTLIAPDYLNRDVYCCGPQSFMASVKTMLLTQNFDPLNYHEESFSAPIESKTCVPDINTDQNETIEIHFALSNINRQARPGESLLTVARAAGIVIPSACQFGMCGTCKVKKHSGNIEMHHNGGISQNEIEAGYILACCSQPKGNVSIDV
ncbi:hybrid-cluster NAD(P)-dependent oxidoreductase [Amphritea sp. 2_MG-2023]|uniref:hybrid-cluster NAD(P)-dependent oxidoreductase n=1 Tax=Amphritea TaxID=515417 RepID=UPI001C07C41D|nr:MULTISPECIES: hybrid-cluster NAD(P)-dependent oxidoreductase [Amphritea]MBU2967307.1 hybrid-cluster NAD(P)-dependent oxidoreductase [Amphritea atlantica]MDO6420455.1 hybrid-cluster NAD(P)-dependent oxidoreductase [Amphritea sp. 2_MG-2023]MDX2421684.1 hybrid-cluster NAD(P)-dependent oxidoreductase [Amphritea sp.]